MNLSTGEACVHGRVREDGGGAEADLRGVRHQVQVQHQIVSVSKFKKQKLANPI